VHSRVNSERASHAGNSERAHTPADATKRPAEYVVCIFSKDVSSVICGISKGISVVVGGISKGIFDVMALVWREKSSS
jgi:hypothetical protein